MSLKDMGFIFFFSIFSLPEIPLFGTPSRFFGQADA
jgi:hypothetical protein